MLVTMQARRAVMWCAWVGGCLSVLLGIAYALMFHVAPRAWPQWTVRNSPFVGPAMEAVAQADTDTARRELAKAMMQNGQLNMESLGRAVAQFLVSEQDDHRTIGWELTLGHRPANHAACAAWEAAYYAALIAALLGTDEPGSVLAAKALLPDRSAIYPDDPQSTPLWYLARAGLYVSSAAEPYSTPPSLPPAPDPIGRLQTELGESFEARALEWTTNSEINLRALGFCCLARIETPTSSTRLTDFVADPWLGEAAMALLVQRRWLPALPALRALAANSAAAQAGPPPGTGPTSFSTYPRPITCGLDSAYVPSPHVVTNSAAMRACLALTALDDTRLPQVLLDMHAAGTINQHDLLLLWRLRVIDDPRFDDALLVDQQPANSAAAAP